MRRADESGFAMLLVFLMASIVAIGLYYELPRVAMEAQRQKEQLLIERGEQYKRAIQLFYKKAGRYPAEIKDLESFQNQRFLRRRYIDPMTGKDEWRLIHIQNGALTDSLINKPKAKDDQQQASTLGQYIGMQAGALDPPGTQAGASSAKDRRRASDGGNPATIGPDGQPLPGQIPGMPNSGPYPGQLPMAGGQPNPNGNPNGNSKSELAAERWLDDSGSNQSGKWRPAANTGTAARNATGNAIRNATGNANGNAARNADAFSNAATTGTAGGQ